MLAYNDEVRLMTLSIADGLAGETVNRVMKDHAGRIWIATNNGVNIYNGRGIATFRLAQEKQLTVNVNDLCETADGSIYAATDAGLYRLGNGEKSFQHILPEVQNPECLLAVGNTLYLGGKQGMQVYEQGELRQRNVGVSGKGLDNVVRQYAVDDHGFIYFLSRYDLNRYDPKTGKTVSCGLSRAMPEHTAVHGLCLLGKCCFVGTRSEGLYLYDMQSQQAKKIEDVGNVVTSVDKSTDGYVTVSTDGSGAYLIDGNGRIVEHFNADAEDSHRLPTNAVYTYMRDANGINWFGFVRYGLAYTPHNSQLFRPYGWEGFTTLGMNVRTHCMRGAEGVIGTQNGCWYVDSKRRISRFFSPAEMSGGHIVNSVAWFEGEYYIGTFDGGVSVLNPQTLTMRSLTEVPQLRHSSIGDIKTGPDGRLWIGSSQGLFIIDKQGNMVRYTEQNSHIVGGIIISIAFDGQKNAWLTGATGISLYSAASSEIVEPRWPEGFFHQQPYMRGTPGHDGIVYMRTGPQVYYSNATMSSFGELPLPITLSDKWCRSMADDGKGHLWLASERGLLRFGYDMTGMLQIGGGEGLLGELISEVSIDENGLLWVATSRGLFTARPEALERWRHNTAYKVRLFHIRRGSDLLTSPESMRVNDERAVRLTWNMGSEVLQAEPTLPDYAQQRSRLYEYRIDGHEWMIVKNDEPIEVRGLWPGRHKLEVRLAGADGTMTVYKVMVVPSAWAIFEAILLLAALVLLWMWWRYRKSTRVLLSERNEIEDALIEVENELQEANADGLMADGEGNVAQKYQKVKIDERECADIVKRMRQYIEKNKVYTNADLKMKDLADVLRLSPSKLSQVFNLYLNENYYEFINRYRLDEFKRLIEAGEYHRYTITALSEQCGFKKSNFFSTFRKVEGMTPAEYLKKHGVKV